MTKVLLINGSPRKNGNTATLLRKAQEGAKKSGAETEYIDLVDLNFKGCMSCFGCKLINGPHRCVWQDDLLPVLKKIEASDAVVFGSPIYFMHLSALMIGCIERFAFPYYTYDNAHPSVFPHKLKTAFIYTMNAEETQIEPYKKSLNSIEPFCRVLFGKKPEVLYSYNTWQYPDYAKYEHKKFNVEEKKVQREVQFPKDCEAAFAMGERMGE